MARFNETRSIKQIKEYYDKLRIGARDKASILHHAKEDRWGHGAYSRPTETTFHIVRYTVTDATGNVIRVEEFAYPLELTGATIKEIPITSDQLIDWIFDNNKEKEWFLEKYEHIETTRTYYDPDLMQDKVDKWLSQINDQEKDSIREAEERDKHRQRWQEACKWAKDHGVKYIGRVNRFTTVRRNVIEAGLVEEWNELYPEWKITDE